MSGILFLTSGDPAGIGPEVTCKALADLPSERRSRVIVLGTGKILDAAQDCCGTCLNFQELPVKGGRLAVEPGRVGFVNIPVDDLSYRPGVLHAINGEAAYRYIVEAVNLAQDSTIPACIVTAPINKAALNAAGHHHDGHTGLLAHLTGQSASWMMLTSEILTVVHVSTHVALRQAILDATPQRVLATIETTERHLRRLGNPKPRIAVAGINPHCGENGLFGTEDDENLTPAVAQARAKGIDVHGPIPGDSVYRLATLGQYDAVIAQYHDQGHIPIKMVAFDTAVNVSLGLPIDRVSVDHGTAYEIAGKNVADHTNMLAAIAVGEKLIETRQSEVAREPN